MERIAFFGLGAMGLPIALNLAKAGYHMQCVIHKNPAGPKELESVGGKIMPSIAEAVKDADIIFTIVPKDHDLIGLLTDPELVNNIKKDAIIIDMTTASPSAIMQVEEFYKNTNVKIIDAPISGGVPSAKAATMTIMGSGDDKTFASIKPVLESIGKTIYYLGKTGQGKMFKCINNLLSALNCAATAEIYYIAKKNGMDLSLVYDVIKKSSGDSVMFERKFPKMQNNDYSSSFTLDLMKKDVGLSLHLAEGVYAPMSTFLYEKIMNDIDKYANEDCCAMAKCLYDLGSKNMSR